MAQYWFSSARGRRMSMEDCDVIAECPVSKWILFAVCDGHGGTGVVKYLEKLLSKRVLAALNRASLDGGDSTIPIAPMGAAVVASIGASTIGAYARPVRASYLRQALKLLVISLDAELHREMKTAAERNSGSTLIMMAYQPLTRQIVLVNVGDSRAVLSLPNLAAPNPPASKAQIAHTKIAPVSVKTAVLAAGGRKMIETKDHKPGDKEELARITAAGSFVARNRVGGILALSRAMGDFSLKTSTKLGGGYDPVTGAVCALPDVQVGYINPASPATAVLACDGIWDVMSSQEALDVAEQSLSRGENPAEKLVHTAFQKLSSDNLTCLVVRIHTAFRPSR